MCFLPSVLVLGLCALIFLTRTNERREKTNRRGDKRTGSAFRLEPIASIVLLCFVSSRCLVRVVTFFTVCACGGGGGSTPGNIQGHSSVPTNDSSRVNSWV